MGNTYFGRLVREGPPKEATFEHSPEGSEGMSHVDSWRRQVGRSWASLRKMSLVGREWSEEGGGSLERWARARPCRALQA